MADMQDSANYEVAKSPAAAAGNTFDEANKAAARLIKPNAILYTSALLSWLQPFQSGWSTSQMNLSQYNDTDECNARPVAEGTCLMFPGHSKLEWTFAVNAWIFDAMVGSRKERQLNNTHESNELHKLTTDTTSH